LVIAIAIIQIKIIIFAIIQIRIMDNRETMATTSSSSIELNPFVIGSYAGDDYFCDRVAETALLKKQIENGRNVTLIAPRRVGKTGLIHHFFAQPDIAERYHTFFVDIYATDTLAEFVRELGKTIFHKLKPRGRRALEQFFHMVTSLQMGFKVDAMTGEPSFQIGCNQIAEPEATLSEIFNYLSNADRPCIVALDEFQQVANYRDGNAEALLRTHIQQGRNCTFIFSGSKRHLMLQMFQSAKRPFYNSTTIISLDTIALQSYTEFAQRLFANRQRQIATDAVSHLYQLVGGLTWHMQLLLNEAFALTPIGGEMTVEACHIAMQNILDLQSANYQAQLAMLTPPRRELLTIIAREGDVSNILSSEFVRSHGLTSASSVQSQLRALLRDELVERTSTDTYRLPDPLFAIWLRTRS
jgi:hypothetical protein